MDGLHFIYFSDPMCSWCYGFSPVIRALRRRYEDVLPIRLVMGGLRPGTTEPMDAEALRALVGHWDAVAEASGQPFERSVEAREGLVYDTDPAARAVVLARRTSGGDALDLLERAQRAFYAEARDITRPATLADVAADVGFDRGAFLSALDDEGLKAETWRDYAISQRSGATAFPTLIVGPNSDGTFALVTKGWQSADDVIGAVDGWLARVRPLAS